MLTLVIDRVIDRDSPSLHSFPGVIIIMPTSISKSALIWMINYTVTPVIENFWELLTCSGVWRLVVTG